MIETPLVTVVCLCYNHERFVEEAILSVIRQTYENIQIVVVDDVSTDRSREIIQRLAVEHPTLELLLLGKNLGNCAAFNQGLARARGKYIVDFATDDVMMLDRIERQVEHFMTLDESYGVSFTDAIYIDDKGKLLEAHYPALRRKGLLTDVPQGEIFADVLTRYFIAGPTMLIKTEMLRAMGGYDEALSYEDFDFWVRSSRKYKYGFLDARLTKIRRLQGSMSTYLYRRGDRQLHSTYLVCRKALEMVRDPRESQALTARVKYQMRQAVFTGNRDEAELFYKLLLEIGGGDLVYKILFQLSKFRVPIRPLKRIYDAIRYS